MHRRMANCRPVGVKLRCPLLPPTAAANFTGQRRREAPAPDWCFDSRLRIKFAKNVRVRMRVCDVLSFWIALRSQGVTFSLRFPPRHGSTWCTIVSHGEFSSARTSESNHRSNEESMAGSSVGNPCPLCSRKLPRLSPSRAAAKGQKRPRRLYEGVAAMPLNAATPGVSCRC
jgi:hypothetical protein